MAVGPVGAGKSTLIHALFGGDPVHKTQSLSYMANSIDTPGEFVNNPFYHHALFATALEADLIVFMQPTNVPRMVFPPRFTSGFPKKSIGVVNKIDLPEGNIERSRRFLEIIGVAPEDIFLMSARTGEGLEEFKEYIEKQLKEEV